MEVYRLGCMGCVLTELILLHMVSVYQQGLSLYSTWHICVLADCVVVCFNQVCGYLCVPIVCCTMSVSFVYCCSMVCVFEPVAFVQCVPFMYLYNVSDI